jgi:hypothetical protein
MFLKRIVLRYALDLPARPKLFHTLSSGKWRSLVFTYRVITSVALWCKFKLLPGVRKL